MMKTWKNTLLLLFYSIYKQIIILRKKISVVCLNSFEDLKSVENMLLYRFSKA